MARKRKPVNYNRPWCWYCEVVFDCEKNLSEHQRKSHFACQSCNKKHKSASSLVEHCKNEHKIDLKAVPSALPGRDSVLVPIRGTEGIPESDLIAHNQKLMQLKESDLEFEETGADTSESVSLGTELPPQSSTALPYQTYAPKLGSHMAPYGSYPSFPNHPPMPMHHYEPEQAYPPVHPMHGAPYYPDPRYQSHLYPGMYRPPPVYGRPPPINPYHQSVPGKQGQNFNSATTSEKHTHGIPAYTDPPPASIDITRNHHNRPVPPNGFEPSSIPVSRPTSLTNDSTLSRRDSVTSTQNSEPETTSRRSSLSHADSSRNSTSKVQKENHLFKHPTDKLLNPHAFSPSSVLNFPKKTVLSNFTASLSGEPLRRSSLPSNSQSYSQASAELRFHSPGHRDNFGVTKTVFNSLDRETLWTKESLPQLDDLSECEDELKAYDDSKSTNSSPPGTSNNSHKEVVICQIRNMSLEEARAQDKRYKYSNEALKQEAEDLDLSIDKHVALIVSKRAN